MKLVALRLTNFRQHVATEIAFERGITGIIGPNGAGKTTVLEAIAFALYAWGRSSRDLMLSISAAGRPQMRVDLEFELGRHRYRVVRGRTSAELYVDGGESPVADSFATVNERLQRLLGMSRDEFFRTYFTEQKELAFMSTLGPADRGRFLSKVLGYEKLRVAQLTIAERRKVLAGEIQGMRAGLPEPEVVERATVEANQRVTVLTAAAQSAAHRHSLIEARLAMVKPKWELVQANREKMQLTAAEIGACEKDEASFLRDLERVAAELAAIDASRGELGELQQALEPLGELRAELEILEGLYHEEGRRRALAESESELSKELEALRARLEAVEKAPGLEEGVTLALERKRAELDEALGALEARRTEWVRDRQEANTKHKDLRQQIAGAEAQRARVVALGAEGICPTCNRVLGENLQNVVDQFTEQIDTLGVDLRYFHARVEQLSNAPAIVSELDERSRALTREVAVAEKRLTRVKAAVEELGRLRKDIANKDKRIQQLRRDIAVIARGFDSARYELVKSEIARLTPLESKAAKVGALLDREGGLLAERNERTVALGKVRSTLGTLRVRHKQMAFATADYETIKASFEKCSAEARAAELEAHTAAGNLNAAKEAFETAVAALESARARQATIAVREEERRLHEELDRAFNEMRATFNAELRPELSELASSFLRDLMDSRTAELELDDKYNIGVLEDGIPKPVLSGGEEDLANLALRLGVSQMIAERSGQAFSLLVLDEVFGSLDETRRYNVLDLLRRLGDRFEQVILITHIESVRDGVDNVISVRFDPALAASVVTQSGGGAGLAEEIGAYPDEDDAATEILRAG